MNARLNEILGRRIINAVGDTDKPEEIRIKRGCNVVVRYSTRPREISCLVNSMSFDEIFERIIRRSLHAYHDQILRGYIDAGEGIRVGVAGRAVTDGETICSVCEIDSLVIRVPHDVRNVCHPLYEKIVGKTLKSALIFSPPGAGKTTLIRDLAIKLASAPHPRFVALIDPRGELYQFDAKSNPYITSYTGYPKTVAMNAAIRTSAPDVIITDEIGTQSEAEAIIDCQNSGVAFIATAHGDSLQSIMRKPGIRMLHEAGLFDLYCRIERNAGSQFGFEFYDRGDVGNA